MIGQAGTSPEVDCDKLDGRLREICEGTSGIPEMGEGNTREAYLKLWAREPPWKPRPLRFRLGDFIASLIHRVTFGCLKPTPGCGCKARQEKLNRFGEIIGRLFARLSTSRGGRR